MINLLSGDSGYIWDWLSQQQVEQPVIDLGGGQRTYDKASVVVDLLKPDGDAQWVQADLCDTDWALMFKDKAFGFVLCNHTLEDIRDPIGVLKMATKIARRGAFGTPHWTYEAGIRGEREDWEKVSGYPHHRWLVGVNRETGAYEFMAKQCWFVQGEYEYSTPNLNLEWDGGEFPYAEITNLYPGRMKRDDLLRWLEGRWLK